MSEEVKRINYDVPEELHRRMRTQAARRGITLKQWHEEALTTEVERQEAEAAEAERKRRSR